jgi:hypothetical protein
VWRRVSPSLGREHRVATGLRKGVVVCIKHGLVWE